MATEPRHLHRLLAFLDPLFGCAALIVETAPQRCFLTRRVAAGVLFISPSLFPLIFPILIFKRGV